MANTYKKPEIKTIKVELQQVIAQSKLDINGEGNSQWGAKENNFDFFAYEEEEEAPGKSDDDDSWDEDWEEEEF